MYMQLLGRLEATRWNSTVKPRPDALATGLLWFGGVIVPPSLLMLAAGICRIVVPRSVTRDRSTQPAAMTAINHHRPLVLAVVDLGQKGQEMNGGGRDRAVAVGALHRRVREWRR